MKLKNKKTGEIGYFCFANWDNPVLTIMDKNGIQLAKYTSLAELNEEWEDVPEEPKDYWAIDCFVPDNDLVSQFSNCSESVIENRKSIGNYFDTREEAELAVSKLKAWKRLKDNGFKTKGWKFTPDMKQIQGNYVKIEAEIPQILINEKDLDLLFGGEE